MQESNWRDYENAHGGELHHGTQVYRPFTATRHGFASLTRTHCCSVIHADIVAVGKSGQKGKGHAHF
jgi:hypothetical protein